MTDNYRKREITDLLVSLIHIAFVAGIYGSDSDFLDTVQGKLILALEVTTIVFHLGYLLLYYQSNSLLYSGTKFHDQFNQWKWLEYAISATLGTLATAYVSGESSADFNLLLLLCAAGVAQQSQGYLLEVDEDSISNNPKGATTSDADTYLISKDNTTSNVKWKSHVAVAYLSAILLQAGEFAVVYDVIPEKNTNEVLAYSNYTLGYSTFGIIMIMCLSTSKDVVSKTTWEILYSIAGLAAKLAILFSDYGVYSNNQGWIISGTVLVALFLVALLWWFSRITNRNA